MFLRYIVGLSFRSRRLVYDQRSIHESDHAISPTTLLHSVGQPLILNLMDQAQFSLLRMKRLILTVSYGKIRSPYQEG